MRPSSLSKKRLHVAVCVDNARAHGRGILQGIADYVETYGPWSLFVDLHADSRHPEGRSKDWKGDGILTYIEDPVRAERLRRSGIPTVELFAYRADGKLPLVANDDLAIGRLAAEHLMERCFKHYAFTGYCGSLWSQRRKEGFIRGLSNHHLKPALTLDIIQPSTLPDWEAIQQQLISWLSSLPKPVGLMACSDRHAQRVLDACQRGKIAVPEEIAVIGVDNNEEICRLSDPPLTSVMDDARRIGFEGARILHRLMRNGARKRLARTILIRPLGIVTRRSTDVTAIDDRLMAEVVRYIREHACEGLNIKELPGRFGLSRSVFYRRFQAALQRSPHEEIVRVQLERARTLLAQTKLSLEKVAELSGFRSTPYFSVAFKRRAELTPGEYRETFGPPK